MRTLWLNPEMFRLTPAPLEVTFEAFDKLPARRVIQTGETELDGGGRQGQGSQLTLGGGLKANGYASLRMIDDGFAPVHLVARVPDSRREDSKKVFQGQAHHSNEMLG